MIRFGKFWFVFMCIFICGCFEVSQEITLNKDGSGRLVERMMMSKDVMNKMNEFFASFAALGASGGKSKSKNKEGMDIYDKDKLIADAAKYGPDVKYVSSKKVSTANKDGYEVVYEFKDINNLRINQNPSDKGPQSKTDAKENAKEENIVFQFQKGEPSTLTIVSPKQDNLEKEKKKRAEKQDKAAEQKELSEMRDVFKDLYIGIFIRPSGKIIETNATYNDNGRITLLEMDFAKLVANEKQFESFAKAKPETVEASKELLKKIPGFKVDLNEKVIIKFE